MYEYIDFYFRIILMGFYFLLLIKSLQNYKNAKENELHATSKYFLAFSFFFLISLVNYIQAEINLQFGIYPDDVFWTVPIGGLPQIPFTTMMFILFFIPSIIPIIYIIEKYFQKWEIPYVTIFGLISFFLFVLTLIIPTIAPVTMIIAVLSMALLLTLFISIYIKMAIKSEGLLRKSAIFIIIGWVLQLIAILYPMSQEPLIEPIIAHIIAIIGATILYYGLVKSSD